MRSTKTMMLLTVIVCVLVLGVAYAAIQNVTLTVTGNVIASPDQGNFDVHFTGTPSSSGTGSAEVKINSDLSAIMNVSGMKKAGDTMTGTFKIINESNGIAASLTKSVTHTNSEYFTVTATLSPSSIDDGEQSTLTITVKLIKTPISSNVTDKITIKVVASPEHYS